MPALVLLQVVVLLPSVFLLSLLWLSRPGHGNYFSANTTSECYSTERQLGLQAARLQSILGSSVLHCIARGWCGIALARSLPA